MPTVAAFDPLATPDWDAKVAALTGTSFFHTAAWARILRETYGYTPAFFVGETDDRLQSLLPVCEVDSWLTGRRGVALPFADAVAPACADAAAFQSLLAAVVAHGKARRWRYLELRGGRQFLPDAPASTSFLGHRLDLRPGETALSAGFESSARRAVRKAESGALSIEFSRAPEAMQAFHHLLCLTRKRHGLPPQPYRFFAAIQRHILSAAKGWIVLARFHGRPVAAAVFFHSGTTALYKFGASDERFQHLRANNLVMARAIQWHAANGFETLDFGRTSLGNEGLRRFKLSWGAREFALDYFRLDLRHGGYATATDQTEGRHVRFFRAMPIPVARLIGALLYRHMG